MKSDRECEALAKKHVEEYVNACKCNSREEVALAIQKLGVIVLHANTLVRNGKMETEQ